MSIRTAVISRPLDFIAARASARAVGQYGKADSRRDASRIADDTAAVAAAHRLGVKVQPNAPANFSSDAAWSGWRPPAGTTTAEAARVAREALWAKSVTHTARAERANQIMNIALAANQSGQKSLREAGRNLGSQPVATARKAAAEAMQRPGVAAQPRTVLRNSLRTDQDGAAARVLLGRASRVGVKTYLSEAAAAAVKILSAREAA